MPVEDVFSISGRGTVVTGRIERGIIKVGDEVEIVGIKPTAEDHVSRAWRCSASCWTRARRATTSGLLLRGTKREDVERGQVLAQAGHRSRRTPSSRPRCMCLSKEEGGRHTPFFKGYRPQFYFRTTDVTGRVRAAGRAWRW